MAESPIGWTHPDRGPSAGLGSWLGGALVERLLESWL
jgi:hypothetical protein